MLKLKRVYETPEAADGFRVLVDRLWPRGVSKEKAALDAWAKEVAPSPELRAWFNHEPDKFEEFRLRYEEELSHNEAAGSLLEIMREHPTVTLVYAARDPKINHAVVLRNYLQSKVK